MVEKVVEHDYYAYGDSKLFGTAEHPHSINVFLKGIENGQEVFRNISMVPPIWKEHTHYHNGFQNVHKICKELGKQIKAGKITPKAVIDNVVTALIGTTLPCINKFGHWVINKNNHDHSDDILGNWQVSSQREVAGIAVNGEVVGTMSLPKLDTALQSPSREFNNAERVFHLKTLIQLNFEVYTEEAQNRKVDVQPVKTTLLDFFQSISDSKLIERDIEGIQLRIDRIISNKDYVGKDAMIKLREITKLMADFIRTQHEQAKAKLTAAA